MRNRYFISVVSAAALAFSVSACNSIQTDIAAIDGTAQSALLRANLALAKEAPTVAAFIDQHITQADNYFQQIVKTGLLSPSAIASEKAAVAKVKAYAANTPTTVAGVAADLAAAFTAIQNASTIVGS